tara:strand:+ start:244 stop:471 length:228 start_codon:yes stop_codon:yes gene_type:complete
MEIEKQSKKVLKELSLTLGNINLEETYYVVDKINVTRGDGEPTKYNSKFKIIIRKNAPKMDENGSYIMEAGGWID